jgi:hypothetical protein
VVALLLAYGAAPNVPNKSGLVARQEASGIALDCFVEFERGVWMKSEKVPWLRFGFGFAVWFPFFLVLVSVSVSVLNLVLVFGFGFGFGFGIGFFFCPGLLTTLGVLIH